MGVWGSWFRVQGSGFMVQGSGFRGQVSGFKFRAADRVSQFLSALSGTLEVSLWGMAEEVKNAQGQR
jgi:hypothetical protein